MSQSFPEDFPIDPTTTSGTALADILNRFSNAVESSNSGAAAPTETFPGMQWLDTSAGANGVLKMRDMANTGWVTLFDSKSPPINAGALAPYAKTADMNAADALRVLKTGDIMTGRLVTPALHLVENQFYIGPGGSGRIINFSPQWYLDWNSTNGNLGWARPSGLITMFAADGAIVNQGGIFAEPDRSFGMTSGSGYKYLSWQSGYAIRWTVANGVFEILQNNAAALTIDYAGNTSIRGSLNVPNAGFAANTVTSNSTMVANGRLIANSGIDVPVGNVSLGATSYLGPGGLSVQTYSQSGNMTFANAIASNPAGLLIVMSLQHSPGQFGHCEFQVGQAVFDLRSDNTAYKGGGATTWSIPSDRRLKQDIADYTGGLDQILALRTRTFRYISEPDAVCYGVIADEAEPVMGEIIRTNGGMIDGVWTDDVKSLYADPVQWALVNAVKTLHSRIAALEA